MHHNIKHFFPFSLFFPYFFFLFRNPQSEDFLRSHEEIEEVLEYYLKDCNALLEKSNYLVVTIQNAEDLVRKNYVEYFIF